MRLNDVELLALINENPDVITPKPEEDNISGITIDVHLSNEFSIFKQHKAPYVDLSGDKEELQKVIDMIVDDPITIPDHELFYIHPGELVLGCLHEVLNIPDNMVGWLDGRSSLARLGLATHVTANRIDPGFKGQVVLEFHNTGKLPLALKPKMKIGAISIEKLSSDCAKPYRNRKDSKYKGQMGATPSKIASE